MILFRLITLFLLSIPVSRAADDIAWNIADGPPPIFQPAFLENKDYNEAWEFFFSFEDGSFMSVQLSMFNVGSSDHRILMIGKLTTADGVELLLKNGRARDEWSYDPSEFDLRVLHHRLYRDGDDFKLVVKNVNGEVEITATPQLDPWDIGYTVRNEGGKGRVDFQYVSVFAPRLAVTARYRLSPEGQDYADGVPWVDLPPGVGMAIRQVTSVDLSKLLKAWVRIAPDKPNTDSEGIDVMPAIHLFVGNKIEMKHRAVFFRDNEMLAGEIQMDMDMSLNLPEDPENCCDMVIPISGEISEIGRKVDGTLKFTGIVQSFDLVDVLSSGDRFLASFGKTPRHRRYTVEYDLVVEEGGERVNLSGTGFADSVRFK